MIAARFPYLSYEQMTMEEFSRGFCNTGARNEAVMITLRAYFDDSGDPKREQFAAIGGLVSPTGPWNVFDTHWSVATYDLKGPFHATDCESQRGIFKGWSIDQSSALMKKLVGIIRLSGVMTFGAVVPIPEYRAVFPNSGPYDPYFLAFKQAIINMAGVAYDITHSTVESVGMRIIIEDGDSSSGAFDIWHQLRRLQSWNHARYLTGFDTGTKQLLALQGADLMAREAYKHAANRGIRRIRKPVKELKGRISFHLWTRDSLEYLKSQGGPQNLQAMTNWGLAGKPPQMLRFYGSTFDEH
jgi:hypothetical protein